MCHSHMQGSVLGPFFFLMYTLLYSLSALDLPFLDPAGRHIYLINLLLTILFLMKLHIKCMLKFLLIQQNKTT